LRLRVADRIGGEDEDVVLCGRGGKTGGGASRRDSYQRDMLDSKGRRVKGK
jgi:hypothetical protein